MGSEQLIRFSPAQIEVVNESVSMAEELVSEVYKMSAHQWLKFRYDVKTLKDLSADEVVVGPFAQVIRYVGRSRGRSLSSSAFNFYKICLQDHSILAALEKNPDLKLFPFLLYVAVHELVHIVRFGRFFQMFDVGEACREDEEVLVHRKTYSILHGRPIDGIEAVLRYHEAWHRGKAV